MKFKSFKGQVCGRVLIDKKVVKLLLLRLLLSCVVGLHYKFSIHILGKLLRKNTCVVSLL